MTTPEPGQPPAADCPPNCAECAADDGGAAELEAEADVLLARHNPGCVGEAVEDAYDLGHDDPDGIRFVAAQLLEDGHSPCRCTSHVAANSLGRRGHDVSLRER